jgi:ribosomal protein S18 acetylase RimI-like enzyme
VPSEFERAEESCQSVWLRLGRVVPDGATAEADGLLHVSTGFPGVFWNCTIASSEANRDPNAVIDSAQRFFAPRHVPYTIRFRSSDRALEDACSSRGLVKTIPVTFMFASTSAVPTVVSDLVIRPITDSPTLHAAVEIECEAFKTDAIRVLYTEALFADGRMKAFLGTVDGEPVGTVQLVTSEQGIGIYDVAVASSHRRRGFGSTLVRHAMSVANQMGYAEVSLDSSQVARPMYERLGFHFVGEHTRMKWPDDD